MTTDSLFKTEYSRLNTGQKQAVEALFWPVMVVAWPWTWKTQIIWLRTANIILKAWVEPRNILITTFTEAWVIAIRKRLVKFLWNEAYKVNVSTIHSLAQDIIKTFPEKFLEYKAGSPIDDVDAFELIKEIIDKLSWEKQLDKLITSYDKYFYLRDIKSRIWNLKGEWVSISRLKILIERQRLKYEEELLEIKPTLKKYETTRIKQETHILKLEELCLVFAEYNKELRAKSQYDFNDMINFVLEKFKEDEELKFHYAEKFQFIMLDEYQDTNNAQNTIIDMILSVSEWAPNIMVVWDDDQSIYRFQWANIENMLDFSTHYSDTQFVVLEDNYRSTSWILDLWTQLIVNNEERLTNKIETIDKKLVSSWILKSNTNKPVLFRAKSDMEEKSYVINNIRQLLEQWTLPEEIAIIVRWNREVEQFTQLLLQNNIEAESKLKTDILKSEYIIFILNYLTVINNPYSDENILIDLMRNDLVWLQQVDILRINRALYVLNYSRKINMTMIDFLLDESNLEELHLSDKASLINFRDNLLAFGSELASKSFIAFFNDFIEKTWILLSIEANGSFDDLEDIFTFFNKIKSWNISDKKFNTSKLLSKIDLHKTYNYSISRQVLKKWKNWVQVLTAHSSKWLEYDVVFVPGLFTWNWEWKRVIDRLKLPEWIAWDWLQTSNFQQIEEDRRLFFVAVTRAKENLFLSFPAWIGTKPLLQSVFIEEIKWCYNDFTDLSTLDQNGIYEIISHELINNLITYSDLEFSYIEEFLDTYKLSPSDLNVFLEDPISFLHRVVFKYPFVDNKFTIFGKVYHRTLELFYLKYKSDQKLPEKDYLLTTFSILLGKEILIPDEYEELKEKWKEWLHWYYDICKSKKSEPLVLEYSFRRKNIIFEWVPLTWTIDKIEKVWESDTTENISEWQWALFKDSVALIDYKTWKAKTIGQIKWLDRYWNKKEWEWKYFRQLLFYKLLCDLDPEFDAQFDVWSLAIDFVEWKEGNYKYIEVDYTLEDYEEFKVELQWARVKIRDIKFWKEVLHK